LGENHEGLKGAGKAEHKGLEVCRESFEIGGRSRKEGGGKELLERKAWKEGKTHLREIVCVAEKKIRNLERGSERKKSASRGSPMVMKGCGSKKHPPPDRSKKFWEKEPNPKNPRFCTETRGATGRKGI